MAFFDTARKVCRLKDNASDNFLEILEPTDVFALLEQMPSCSVVVTTGGKASEEICGYFCSQGVKVDIPKVGESVSINSDRWNGTWWRMPSSSRAYPMKLEKKAEYYKRLFCK
jgi:G:T/U-mismatch repair DNA glycosylase